MSQPTSSNLALYNKFAAMPMGKAIFSKLVCFKAPYFASIKPLLSELKPGFAEVKVRKHRAVLNHLNTVHAIAMCNMAELAGGMVTDATVPNTHRWIPKHMDVDYLKKATTDVVAHAHFAPLDNWPDSGDFIARVDIKNLQDEVVAHMDITMYVTRKPAKG